MEDVHGINVSENVSEIASVVSLTADLLLQSALY